MPAGTSGSHIAGRLPVFYFDLETPLTILPLALFLWQLYRTEKTWVPAAIAGLLPFNRMDIAVLLVPVMA